MPEAVLGAQAPTVIPGGQPVAPNSSIHAGTPERNSFDDVRVDEKKPKMPMAVTFEPARALEFLERLERDGGMIVYLAPHDPYESEKCLMYGMASAKIGTDPDRDNAEITLQVQVRAPKPKAPTESLPEVRFGRK